MMVYPLTNREAAAVRWGVRLIPATAVGVLTVLAVASLAGCGALAGIEKDRLLFAIIDPCDICDAPGVECTPCCHACAESQCYDECQQWPEDCDFCKETAYWDCFSHNCVQRE
jgi:hypothetical protein